MLDIEELFSYHPSNSSDAVRAHTLIREDVKTTAHFLNNVLPESAEKTLAIRALQQALMWANASIAIHGLSVREL